MPEELQGPSLVLLKQSYDRTVVLVNDLLANPKPSYSVDGATYEWADYYTRLVNSLAVLAKQIQGDEPFELRTVGRTYEDFPVVG